MSIGWTRYKANWKTVSGSRSFVSGFCLSTKNSAVFPGKKEIGKNPLQKKTPRGDRKGHLGGNPPSRDSSFRLGW
jgi:hypothetical protein